MKDKLISRTLVLLVIVQLITWHLDSSEGHFLSKFKKDQKKGNDSGSSDSSSKEETDTLQANLKCYKLLLFHILDRNFKMPEHCCKQCLPKLHPSCGQTSTSKSAQEVSEKTGTKLGNFPTAMPAVATLPSGSSQSPSVIPVVSNESSGVAKTQTAQVQPVLQNQPAVVEQGSVGSSRVLPTASVESGTNKVGQPQKIVGWISQVHSHDMH